MATKIM